MMERIENEDIECTGIVAFRKKKWERLILPSHELDWNQALSSTDPAKTVSSDSFEDSTGRFAERKEKHRRLS